MTAYPLSRSATPVEGGVERPHRAAARQHQRPQLGGNRRAGAADRQENRARPGKGQAGTDHARLGGLRRRRRSIREAAGQAGRAQSRKRGSSSSAIPTFASNSVLGIEGNRDIFMNTVGWLSQQENLISMRPKEADDRRLTLTATQQNNLTWLSLLIVPAVVFGTGVYSWWRRR